MGLKQHKVAIQETQTGSGLCKINFLQGTMVKSEKKTCKTDLFASPKRLTKTRQKLDRLCPYEGNHTKTYFSGSPQDAPNLQAMRRELDQKAQVLLAPEEGTRIQGLPGS